MTWEGYIPWEGVMTREGYVSWEGRQGVELGMSRSNHLLSL